jgi:hypothetical protein
MKQLLAIALLLVLWPAVIFAQPSDTHSSSSSTFDNSERIAFNFRSYRGIPSFEEIPQDWTFGRPDLRGYVQYEFKGLWKYGVREIRSRFSREYRNQLRDFWQQSNEHQYGWCDYQRDLDEFSSGGTLYNWWTNRTWMDSLPIEKGGAPTHRIITYGREGDWFDLGPFTVSHDLKVKIKKIGLYIDGEQPLQDLKQKYLPADEENPNLNEANLGAEEQSWYKSDLWKVKFKPSVSIKPFGGSEFTDILRRVSAKAEVQLFTKRGLHFGNIECAAQYDLQNESFEIIAMFSLLTW